MFSWVYQVEESGHGNQSHQGQVITIKDTLLIDYTIHHSPHRCAIVFMNQLIMSPLRKYFSYTLIIVYANCMRTTVLEPSLGMSETSFSFHNPRANTYPTPLQYCRLRLHHSTNAWSWNLTCSIRCTTWRYIASVVMFEVSLSIICHGYECFPALQAMTQLVV
jgi:hypothetical protein